MERHKKATLVIGLAFLSVALAAKQKDRVYAYHGQVDACNTVRSTAYNLYNGHPFLVTRTHVFAHNDTYIVELEGPCLPLGTQFAGRLEDTRRGQKLYIQNGNKEISYWLISSQLRNPDKTGTQQ